MNDVEPTRAETSASPVRPGRSSEVRKGLRVDISGVRSTRSVPLGPGEVAGPAVVATVTVVNDTSRAVDLDFVTVSLTDDRGRLGDVQLGPPTDPLAGTVRAGRRARGTYVLNVATDARNPVTITVGLGEGTPVAVFRGRVPS